MIAKHKMTTGLVLASLIVTSPAPAFARHNDHGNGGHRWRHHHRHNDVDAGDVIAGVAVVGILAALLSSSAKKRKRAEAPVRGDILSEDAAVDACANAAEAEAGARSSVRDITQVDRNEDGWDVEGIVEQRDDWRGDSETDRRRFTCSVRYGAIQNVTIDPDRIAFN